MPKKSRSKYREKILEKMRILNAEKELLSEILKEIDSENSKEEK